MIQFQILSGQQAGRDIVVRLFPFTVGRGAEADFQSNDAGVWDRHLSIQFQRGAGYVFAAQPDALVLVNGERAETGLLRNGDLIELGSMRLRFWLARTRQNSLRWREVITWAALFALFAAQIALIWRLRR